MDFPEPEEPIDRHRFSYLHLQIDFPQHLYTEDINSANERVQKSDVRYRFVIDASTI